MGKQDPRGEKDGRRGIRFTYEIHVVRDPELGRKQTEAILELLRWAATEGVGTETSDAGVGDLDPRSDGLEHIVGPLEGEIVREVWAGRGRSMSAREMREWVNARRPRPLAYTTIQSVMARLAAKGILTRNRSGRRDLYRASHPDAVGLATQKLLQGFGKAAVRALVRQASEEPELRSTLLSAVRGATAHARRGSDRPTDKLK